MTHDLAPVSVFISRKSQRLYVRQAFQPVLETPVTIRTLIARLALTSSPPLSAPGAMTCDGAWSH
jgi:hypothetical protein